MGDHVKNEDTASSRGWLSSMKKQRSEFRVGRERTGREGTSRGTVSPLSSDLSLDPSCVTAQAPVTL